MAHPTRGSVVDGLELAPENRSPQSMSAYDEKQVSPHQKFPPGGTGTGDKTIFGLRRPTFFLLLLLVLVIIIAAVAGGVGGSVAVGKAYDRGKADAAAEGLADGDATTVGDNPEANNDDDDDDDDKPSPTSASSSTSSRVQPPPTDGILALDCPDLSETTQTLKLGDKTYKFRVTCGVNHGSGSGSEDMMILPAYSLNDCMTACASLNELNIVDKTCAMVHFNAHIFTTPKGNCWLKSKIGKVEVNNNPKSKNLQVEAEFLDVDD